MSSVVCGLINIKRIRIAFIYYNIIMCYEYFNCEYVLKVRIEVNFCSKYLEGM